MSRSGYSEDCEQWSLIRWRGAVNSALRGRRGQAFLQEMREALDALPEKKLCAHDLQREDGMCCAIGAVGKTRGIDLTNVDAEWATDSGKLTELFDIADAMVREIEFINDDDGPWWTQKKGESIDDYYARMDEERWRRVSKWVDEQIASTAHDEQREPSDA